MVTSLFRVYVRDSAPVQQLSNSLSHFWERTAKVNDSFVSYRSKIPTTRNVSGTDFRYTAITDIDGCDFPSAYIEIRMRAFAAGFFLDVQLDNFRQPALTFVVAARMWKAGGCHLSLKAERRSFHAILTNCAQCAWVIRRSGTMNEILQFLQLVP